MTISLYSLKQFVVNKKIEIEEEERGLFIRDIQKKSRNYSQGRRKKDMLQLQVVTVRQHQK